MDFYGLDAGFGIVRPLRLLNIQWNRRYYECGDFEAQMTAGDYDPAIHYVYTSERPELGMVEKIETQHTVKGDFVTLSGHFLESMLNWKVIEFDEIKPADTEHPTAVARKLVGRWYVYDNESPNNPPIAREGAKNLGTPTHYESVEGERLGDVTYRLLQADEYSQYIRYNSETGKLNWAIWQGVDRTSVQSTNSYAMFSQSFGNVDEMTVTLDTSAYCNIAFMVYANKAGGDVRTTGYAKGYTSTKPARYLYHNSGVDPEEYATDAKITQAVKAEGKLLLDTEYAPIVNIEAKVNQRNLCYLSNYDLGDKVDVRDDITGTELSARIIEVNEVWQGGRHEVSLQFGNKIPTRYYGKGRWV